MKDFTDKQKITPQDKMDTLKNILEFFKLPKRSIDFILLEKQLEDFYNTKNLNEDLYPIGDPKRKYILEMKNNIRHRGSSAIASKRYSPGIARFQGYEKEIWDKLISPIIPNTDYETDLINNELGRRIFNENQDLNETELLNKVYEDIINHSPQNYYYSETPTMKQLYNFLINDL